MNTIKATVPIINKNINIIIVAERAPVLPNSKVAASALGISATIPENIMSDIPFPIPLCVICSPNHIKNIVPATSEITVVNLKIIPESITTPGEFLSELRPQFNTTPTYQLTNLSDQLLLVTPTCRSCLDLWVIRFKNTVTNDYYYDTTTGYYGYADGKFSNAVDNNGNSLSALTTAFVKKLIKPNPTPCFSLKSSLYFFLSSKIGDIFTSLRVVSIAV